jgi:hypothetical protein
MKLSIHSTIRGKPVSVEDLSGFKWMECSGQRVNLGYGWTNIEAEWPDVFELITVDGCATSAELSSDNRRDEFFVSRQLFMVDIDSGMTIPELFDNEFYNAYGAGFYTTPSHTDSAHRFRIMFVTETPIFSKSLARYLFMGLMRTFAHADPACKDGVRLFYGTPDCVLKEFSNRILPDVVVSKLIADELAREEAQAQERAEVVDDREFPPATVDDVCQILDELRKHYSDLQYYIRRDVTWAVVSAVGKKSAVELMRARWSDHDKTYKYEWFVNDHKRSDIKLGTVVEMIRKHDYTFRKRLTEEDKANVLALQILKKRKMS